MMLPRQGQRIVGLVRGLTALGLAAVFITIGVMGWRLHRMRGDIAAATSEQDLINQQSDQLRQLAVDSRTEILASLDDSMTPLTDGKSLPRFAAFIRSLLNSRPDPSVHAALASLNERAATLVDLSRQTDAWRREYEVIWGDLRHQATLGYARSLITEMRDQVASLEGQRRLQEAIAYRKWRRAPGADADHQARDILLADAQRQVQGGFTDFKNQLAEVARLVEVLGGEEQFDNLADLKDNQLKPVLDRLTRTVTTFHLDNDSAKALSPQSVENLKAAIYGKGYIADPAHQNIEVGVGGLFALRRDALQLRRQRDQLKSRLADLFQKIEFDNASLAESTEARTVALSAAMEQSLSRTWWRVFAFGAGSSAIFIWMAWLISGGIHAQVRVIEQARLAAEDGRKTTQDLMQQQQAAAAELADVHKQLLVASRQAGMAEVATGVLHNVGNVLNSVNISANLIADKIQNLPVVNLTKASAMIEKHRDDLANFLTADDRGKQLPGYFGMVAKLLADENTAMLGELSNLSHGIEHIKQIVQLQQDYAKPSTFTERLNPATLIDDALRINLISIERHLVQIVREVSDTGIVEIDKHKTLQVLINLISNAKNAVKEDPDPQRRVITIRLNKLDQDDRPFIRFQIADTGVGIAAEHLDRIFTHGFTTRNGGHGFGLHTAANTAREMGGSLNVSSEGVGRGATFTLDIPIPIQKVAAQ